MEKKFEKPELDVILFTHEDIITTSPDDEEGMGIVDP